MHAPVYCNSNLHDPATLHYDMSSLDLHPSQVLAVRFCINLVCSLDLHPRLPRAFQSIFLGGAGSYVLSEGQVRNNLSTVTQRA